MAKPGAPPTDIRCPACGLWLTAVGNPGPETFSRSRCRECKKVVVATWRGDKLTVERLAVAT